MKRLPFVLWLIGWRIVYDFGQLEDFWRGRTYPENVQSEAVVLHSIVWIAIALLLWRDGDEQPPVTTTTTINVHR